MFKLKIILQINLFVIDKKESGHYYGVIKDNTHEWEYQFEFVNYAPGALKFVSAWVAAQDVAEQFFPSAFGRGMAVS